MPSSTPASTPAAPLPMSAPRHPAPSPSVSPSPFRLNFNNAILKYNKRTNNDLRFHPLASLFQSCNDPALALSLLQRHAQVSPQPRIDDEQLKTLLYPTLIGLYAISLSDDEGVGLVIFDGCSFRTYFIQGDFLGIITGESYLSCHWYPAFGENLP
jgi:hypothetical protein